MRWWFLWRLTVTYAHPMICDGMGYAGTVKNGKVVTTVVVRRGCDGGFYDG
ncbi:hypothetical protein HanIR_Chr08g0379641 [Helianthus annuus]|nr:hypothetical protein HanIR_Chr08g0379641 [Helianthus annuus]